MSDWGIAGGIGKGIMQGLQFNRQLDADKRTQQALENQTDLLGMQKELHREKMGALTRENEDRLRTDTLGTLDTTIEANYQDRPDYVRKKMSLDLGASMGLLKPADVEKKTKELAALTDAFGETAVSALGRGDIGPMKSMLQTRGFGFDQDAKTGRYLVTPPGATAPIEYDLRGVLEATPLSGYRDRQAARAKAALDAQKTQAETKRLLADAGRLDRMPQDLVRGAGSGKDGKQPPDPSAMFSADAYLERFGVGKDSDPSFRARGDDGFGFYQMLHKANPRLASTPDGNEMLYRLSRDIMNGSVQRETKFDPATMSWNRYVTDSQGGRYKLDRNSIDPRQLKGPDGKPAIEPSVIEQEEMSALKRFSTSRPDKYRLAASLAQAKELTTDELLAAANGTPVSSGSRTVSLSPELANVALMIRRRGMEKPAQSRFLPGGVKRALPDTAGYGAGGSKGTSLTGEAFDKYIADPVTGFFKESARQAREE